MAKTITISLPHELPADEVKRRIVSAIAEARSKHPELMKGAREVWDGNTMTFSAVAMGPTISGMIRIEAKVVHVSVDLPFMMAMLAGKFRPKIEEEGRKLLAK